MKKSISLVVEYMLLTFVVVLILSQMLGLTNGLINKFKAKYHEKEFVDLCKDFRYYLKNLDYKGYYYFPFKVSFNGSFLGYNGYKCKLDYYFCNKTVKGEVLVVKNGKSICFE